MLTLTCAAAHVASAIARFTATDPALESYLAHIAAADSAIKLHEPGEARRWLDHAPGQHRDWEWRLLDAAADESLGIVVSEPTDVTCIAVSPDGSKLALATGGGFVRMWDVPSAREQARLEGHTGTVYRTTFSPDGSRVATASHDRTARVWDASTGRSLVTFSEHKFPVTAAAFLPDGQSVATTSYYWTREVPIEGRVHIWDAATGELRRTLTGGVKPQSSVAISRDGRHLLAGAWGSAIHHWDLTGSTSTAAYFGSQPSPRESIHFDDISVSPDGTLVAGATNEDWIRVFRIPSGEVVTTLSGHAEDATAVAFSPDGQWLATGGLDEVIRVWSTAGWTLAAVLRGHTAGIRSLAWLPDGSTLLSSAGDGTVRRWSTHFARYGPLRLRHPASAYHAPISPDGKLIAAAGDDGFVSIWDANSGEQLWHFEAHPGGQICTVNFSPDARRIVSCSWDKSVRIHEIGGAITSIEVAQPAGVACARFSPDGSLIAAALTNKTARLLDGATGELRRELAGHESRVNDVVFSPDGSGLATAAADATVRVWSVADGTCTAVMRGHKGNVLACVYDTDGRHVYSCGDDGSVRMWDAASGGLVRTIGQFDESVSCLSIHPDGRRLAIATSQTLLIDPASGETVLRLPAPDDKVWNLRFSPDGSRLITLSGSGAICIWETARLVDRLKR